MHDTKSLPTYPVRTFVKQILVLFATVLILIPEVYADDDNWIDGEDITEEELEKDPLYEPHRYYYWHGDIEEDYDMGDYDCLCECCFDILNREGKIKWKDNKNPFECVPV